MLIRLRRSPPFSPRACAWLAVLLMAPTAGPLLAGAAVAHPEPLDISTELRGGWVWSLDQRVTNDPAPDFHPILTIDANNTGDLLWQRNSTGEEVLHYGRLASDGNVSHGPVALSNRSLRTAFDGQLPLGSSAAVDSNDAIHLTYGAGLNITYQKLDENGSTIVGPKVVGPVDASLSRDPTLLVAPDDSVHIVHGDYKFQCEDAAYDKLDNNGNDIWIDRIVSSDVAAKVSRSVIRQEPFGPRFFFAMGSDTGTWYGRFNKFGVKDMASVQIRAQTDYKLVDVAGMVDGSGHLVWQDQGQLYYTRVNATGSKVVNALTLPANGTVSGVPRIAVSMSTDVHIVWVDNRTGTDQVYWLQFYVGQNLTNLTPVQLSTSTSGVADPWVTTGPDGAVHVAWADSRDGNLEIYHKFEVACRLRFDDDPGTLGPGGLVTLLPNETKVLPLTLRNAGVLSEDLTLSVEPALAPFAANWSFTLNQSAIAGFGPGADAQLSLSIYAPPDAPMFDTTILWINATARGGQCIGLTFTQARAVYVRSLSLVPGVTNRSALPGEAAPFTLALTNSGDVPENSVQIGARMDTAHSSWVISGLPSAPNLAPNETASVSLTVTVPADLRQSFAGDVGQLEVWAASSAAPWINVTQRLNITVGTVLDIQLSTSSTSLTVPPGTTSTSRFQIASPGNVVGYIRTNLSFERVSGAVWNTSLSRAFVSIAWNDPTNADLRVTVPADALFGESTTVRVRAVNETRALEGVLNITVSAGLVCNLSMAAEAQGQVAPGQTVQLAVTVTNAGNAVETLTLSAMGLPAGWSARFLDGATPALSVALSQGETRPLVIEATPALDALAGSYNLTLAASSSQCGGASAATALDVQLVKAGTMTVAASEKVVQPGGEAVFELNVTSTTNGPSSWNLTATGLPAGIAPARFQVTRINGSPVNLTEGPSFDLPAFGSAVVEVRVLVPADTERSTVTFNLNAILPQGTTSVLPVIVKIQRPDLALILVEFSPQPVIAGLIAVNMTVKNLGAIASGTTELQLIIDGRVQDTEALAAMAPGANQTVRFQWTAEVGHFEVRIVLGRLTGPTDENLANNVFHDFLLVLPAKSGEPPVTPPPSGSLPGPGALGALAGLAVVVALRRRHRRQ